jgi:TetR/AcrR family transcriptional regulator
MNSEETERRKQIVEAAFAEFASKGFRGATIKSIAKAAELQAPSLIYWYFPTKEALFQAVIESRAPFLRTMFEPGLVIEQPPEEVLLILARSYFVMIEQSDLPQLVRLILSEAVRQPQMAELIAEKFLLRILEFLKSYLAHQVELGRLRPHDTRASARAFIGMLIPQALSLMVFPTGQQDGLTSEEHLQTAVAIFLHGLSPTATE